MKNLIPLLALLLILTSAKPFSESNKVWLHTQIKRGPTVPDKVVTNFNSLVSLLMENNGFGTNYTTNVTWTHYHGQWIGEGTVTVNGGGGAGIWIQAYYKSNGTYLNASYSIL